MARFNQRTSRERKPAEKAAEITKKIKKVKVIPDGSCQFTNHMNMAVGKDNLGFGVRSWRYACVVNNGKIEKWFIEPGKCWDAETDPYGETAPEKILEWLKGTA